MPTLLDPGTNSNTFEWIQKESGLELLRKSKVESDNGTEITSDLSDCSASDSVSCGGADGIKKWSGVVNGIHFIGVDRSGRTAPLCDNVEDCEEFQPQEETMKERNKRLLTLHRESKARQSKDKRIPRPRNRHCSPLKLQPIKEEEARGVIKVDSGVNLDASGPEDATVRDRRQEVELILHRKFKSSESVRKDNGQM